LNCMRLSPVTSDEPTESHLSVLDECQDSPQTVRVEMTIGADLGDVWSHYCTLRRG
jgi:hypothetical protein